MAAQRLYEPPQRPRPTVAERLSGQLIVLEPRGRLLRGTAIAVVLSVAGFWTPLALLAARLS